MVICALPGSMSVICGASGVTAGMGVTATALEATLSPTSLTAISDIKYSMSLVSPVIVIGLVSPVAGTVTTLAAVIFDTLSEPLLAV